MATGINGFIQYGIEKVATVTENSLMGTTANTTIRANSSLPNTLSSGGADANTIYIRPEQGLDSNTGTNFAGDAVKTFAKAMTLVSATRHTIHISEPAGVQPMQLVDTLAGNTIMLDHLDNVQVAAGETCVLTLIGGYYERSNVSAGPLKFNGLHIVGATDQTAAPFQNRNLAGGTSTDYEWCIVESYGACIEPNLGSTQKDSIFIARGDSFACINQLTDILTLNRCALVGGGNNAKGVDFTSSLTTNELAINNCVFVDLDICIELSNSLTTLTDTTNEDHIFHNCATLIDNPSVTAVSSVVTNSLINISTIGSADVSSNTNVLDKNPLFFDEIGHDYRLASTSRKVDGVNYPIDSPAIAIGNASSDAGGFDVTYGAITEDLCTLEFEDNDGMDVNMQPARSNFQSWEDIKGRRRQAFDGTAWKVDIKYPAKYWKGSDFSYMLADMIRRDTLMRFWPEGSRGLFRVDVGFPTVGKTCTFDSATYVLDFTTNLDRDMIKNQFAGWVVHVFWKVPVNIDKDAYFTILSNDETTMTIDTGLRGDLDFLIVGGTSDFSANVKYLPCLLDMKEVTMISENYHESDSYTDMQKPWYKRVDDTANAQTEDTAQWHSRNIKLYQTLEEPE